MQGPAYGLGEWCARDLLKIHGCYIEQVHKDPLSSERPWEELRRRHGDEDPCLKSICSTDYSNPAHHPVLIRSAKALERDLEVLDEVYNTLTDMLARGEQMKFDAKPLGRPQASYEVPIYMVSRHPFN